MIALTKDRETRTLGLTPKYYQEIMVLSCYTEGNWFVPSEQDDINKRRKGMGGEMRTSY